MHVRHFVFKPTQAILPVHKTPFSSNAGHTSPVQFRRERVLPHMSSQADLAKSKARLKNRIFVVLLVLSNSVGNLLLALGMMRLPDFQKVPFFHYLALVATDGWLLLGVALMIVFMLSQLSMYSWADLSYVLPITASTYIVSALLSKFVLHETVSTVRWLGIILISFGVIFVAETPARAEENLVGSTP